MFKRLVYLTLIVSLLLTSYCIPQASADVPGASFYVATNGSDSNSGAIEAPFLTLEKARDAIRQIKTSTGLPVGGITVYLREGTYSRTVSFELNDEDSGTADKGITYRAFPGETVRLSGSAQLEKSWFTPVTDSAILNRIISTDARTKVLQLDLGSHGITDYGVMSRHGYYLANDLSLVPPMELYVAGQGMTLARWPNKDTVQMDEILDAGPTRRDVDLQNRGGTFSYTYDRPQYWTQADDIWLDGIFGYSWEWSYNKVASIDTVNKEITLRYGEMSGIFKNWYPDFHFAQNLLEELDMPGEYYIDRSDGLLYFMPNAAFEAGNPEIAVTMLKTPLINSINASYITFDDLTLENGRDSAAVIMGGTHILITHCEIRNFTNSGVLINTQSRFFYNDFVGAPGTYHGVSSSHIHHIGGTAVTITGGNKGTLAPGNNFVENSHIHDFAYYHKAYNPGVHLSGAGNRVSHNEIHDAPHPGMLIFGNDHLVEYNNIYDVCKSFSDLGAIYMNLGESPQERGTVIRRNYFHNIGETKAGVEGIYPDNFTMGLLIEENIFYKMGNSAIKNNGGAHIITRNNIFIDSKVPYDYADSFLGSDPDDQIPKNYMPKWQALFTANNNFVGKPHLIKYPELADFFTENRYYPTTNVFENNLIYNPTKARSTTTNAQGAYDQYNLVQYANNWIAGSDPGFVDLAGGNLELASDADVFDHIPDFNPIPFSEIGVSGKIGTTQGLDSFPVQDIKIYNDNITLGLSKTVQLNTAVLPWNATNPRLNYHSSDPAIATVDNNGIITGISLGVATITVTSEEDPLLHEQAEVTVEAGDGIIDYTDFESGGNSWTLDGYRTIEKQGSNRWYKIISGATSLSAKEFTAYEMSFKLKTPATIPNNATFYVFDRQGSSGSSRIGYRANTDGTSRWILYNSAWGTVKQSELPGQDLLPNTEYQIKLLVKGADISIYVNDQLKLKGSDPGHNLSGKVGFYVNNFSYLLFDDIKFSIPTKDVSGLIMDQDNVNMVAGEQLPLHVSYDPTDAANTSVTWESSNPMVATVNSIGVVSAVYLGEAVISATSVENPHAVAVTRVVVSNVLHNTDFEKGGNGWAVDPNRSIALLDGNRWYKLLSGASSVLDKTFTDYELNFKLKTPAVMPSNAAFYVFDRQGTSGSSRIGYGVNPDGTSRWILYNSAWTALKQSQLPGQDLLPNTEYQIKLLVKGADISIYVNNQLKLKGTDPGHNLSGKVGLYVNNFSYLLFDDIKFTLPTTDISGLVMDKDNVNLVMGEQLPLHVSYDPTDAANTSVTWASSNPLVATVNNIGVVSAVYLGEAVITATSTGNPNAVAISKVVVSNVLHNTDFENGGNGWAVDPNRSITLLEGNRWYKLLNGASSVLNKTFTDYELNFKLKTPAVIPNNATFYVFDRQGTSGSSRIGYRTGSDGTSRWILYNSAWATVTQSVLPEQELQPDTDYNVKIIAAGANISIYINDVLKLQGTDPGHNVSGQVGFYASGFSYLLLDNIKFTQLP